MLASWFIARKDLQTLLRDKMALFWVVVFPLGFALFFGSVIKAGVDAQAAPPKVMLVVDESVPEAPGIAEGLERTAMQVKRSTREEAVRSVRRGDAVAYIDLRADARLGVAIVVGIDPSHRTESAMVLGLVKSALVPPTSFPMLSTTDVVRESGGPRSGFEIVLPAMLIWGLLGCAATFAVSLVSERSTGTLLRLRAAPVSRGAILAGKSLACASACVADALVLSALAMAIFGAHIDDVPKYAAALGACTICFTGMTTALSVLGKSEQSVAGAGWSTLIVFAMVGGAMVPVSIMPKWLVLWSDLSPVKWGILALEGATWRGLDWHELVRPLVLLTGFGLASFVAGVTVLIAWREV
jgi:ABC-2 type transport system permease protein